MCPFLVGAPRGCAFCFRSECRAFGNRLHSSAQIPRAQHLGIILAYSAKFFKGVNANFSKIFFSGRLSARIWTDVGFCGRIRAVRRHFCGGVRADKRSFHRASGGALTPDTAVCAPPCGTSAASAPCVSGGRGALMRLWQAAPVMRGALAAACDEIFDIS